MPAEVIKIVGARQHNLKNLTVEIPREKLVVVTGLSGSGKSSLAFDTLYAEGQRKYVESLSAYARQFLDQLQKPEVDFIEGLSPAIAIEQRGSAANPRSTISTTTEIYDYLRLLFSSTGQPHDPATGAAIYKLSSQQIADQIEAYPQDSKIIILAPFIRSQTGEFRDVFERIKREGFVRARIDGQIVEVGSDPIKLDKTKSHSIEIVVDRLVIRDGVRARLADSIDTALKWGGSRLLVLRQTPEAPDAWQEMKYSTDFCNPETEFTMPLLTPKHFSFNSHLGACPACHGLGTESFFDCDLMITDPQKSLKEGAVAPWQRTGKRMQHFYSGILRALAAKYHAALDVPYADLPAAFKEALGNGTGTEAIEIVWGEGTKTTRAERPFEGLVAQMQRLYDDTESELTRNRLRQYMSRRECSVCRGARLRPEILAVTIRGLLSKDGEPPAAAELNIRQLCGLTVADARDFVEHLILKTQQQVIVAEVTREILARLGFLVEVGLGYLNLDRESGTLSGGEAQRIRLATQIGSGLAGVLYVLDEPSIGLHQRDNDRLITTLRRLRDLGNSVIVVEHDEDTIRAADFVLDLGPGAGVRGGEIIAQGSVEDVLKNPASIDGPVSYRAPPNPGPEAPRNAVPLAHRFRRHGEQPCGGQRFVSARLLHLRDGCLGEWEVDAGGRHPAAGALPAFLPGEGPAGSLQGDPGAGLRGQGHRHRPEPDRAHAALEPGHLHGGIRADPAALCESAGLACAGVRVRAVLASMSKGAGASIARGKG